MAGMTPLAAMLLAANIVCGRDAPARMRRALSRISIGLERQLVGRTKLESAVSSCGVEKSFAALIEYPVLVGMSKECDLSVSRFEEVVAAVPPRLTVVDCDGRKRIFCVDAVE